MRPTSSQLRKGGEGRRFFSNTMLNFGGQGFVFVLAFATAPYIVHRLGAELYGIVVLVQAIAGFSGLASLGFGRALTKYVSELYWKGGLEEIKQLFQAAWAICIVTGLVGIALMVGPGEAISGDFFRGGPEIANVVPFAVYVAAFGLFSSVLLEAVSAIPGALQRFDVSNGVYMASGGVRYLGSVAVLALGYSVRAVLIVNLGTSIFTVVAFAFASRRLIGSLSLWPAVHWPALRKLFSFSFPLFLAASATMVVTRVDRFILAYFLPLAAVTFYVLPYQLAQKASMGITNVTSVVFPHASELHSMGSHEKVHELYLRASKFLTLVTLPLSAILVVMAAPILRFWLGPEFATQGALALSVLGVATFLNASSAVPTVTVLGIGRPWVQTVFVLGTATINVTANFILIPRYGINGAAFAALLSEVLITPIFVFVVTRILKVSLGRFLKRVLLRPVMCTAVQVVFLLAVGRYANSLIDVGLLCLASLCLYGALSLFGAITREERAALLRIPSFSVNQN